MKLAKHLIAIALVTLLAGAATADVLWNQIQYPMPWTQGVVNTIAGGPPMGFVAYGQSKLANVLFTRELARRLEGTGVTATVMHPGFVNSGFSRNNGWLARLAMTLGSPIARTPDQGADTLLWLASSPEVEGKSGGYYYNRKEEPPSVAARSEEDARRLWQISEEMTGLDGAR